MEFQKFDLTHSGDDLLLAKLNQHYVDTQSRQLKNGDESSALSPLISIATLTQNQKNCVKVILRNMLVKAHILPQDQKSTEKDWIFTKDEEIKNSALCAYLNKMIYLVNYIFPDKTKIRKYTDFFQISHDHEKRGRRMLAFLSPCRLL
jgi:hypothetical protein